jgi:NSS family neurotransmitter:Na+ symporter
MHKQGQIIKGKSATEMVPSQESGEGGAVSATQDTLKSSAATPTPNFSQSRATWSGKWTFILSAAAAAVGLGNLWRFPYLAAQYGGGTFLMVYIVLVFTFGISLLLLEVALGRFTGLSSIGAFRAFNKRYTFIGVFASIIPCIVTSYYFVIGGWVTKYAASYMLGDAHLIAADADGFFTALTSSRVESFVWMYIFMALTFITVARGVKGGIEKSNIVMMPLLILIAIGISIYTLTMPGALEGAAYYLTPDLSMLSPQLVIAALGQLFFSLSLAMGTMVTYGSYLDKHTSLTGSSIRIAGFDVGVSILAGLVIVPAAFVALGSSQAVAENSGPSLMFVILPGVFSDMGTAGIAVGIAFFVLVLFAALTSAISLTETIVSIVMDGLRWPRPRAVAVTFVFLAVMGTVINLGYNGFSFIEPLGPGSTLLDGFDFLANSVMMPLVALATCIFVGWVIKPAALLSEIQRTGRFRLARLWVANIKYILPVLIVIIMTSFILTQFAA